MRTPDGRHVVHIVCLDVRIILPPVGYDQPFFWIRGHAASAGNRKDAANRRDPDPPADAPHDAPNPLLGSMKARVLARAALSGAPVSGISLLKAYRDLTGCTIPHARDYVFANFPEHRPGSSR